MGVKQWKTTNTFFFCGRTGKPDRPYNHFFKTEYQVRMCGFDKKDIAKVLVEETEETEGAYWGFKYLKDRFINANEILFIYPTKMLVEICSPDSFKSEVSRGIGKFVRLRITELTT